ncbi:galectin-2 [Sorex fumeus]|uniref:galectin-2 n=1 Tax=Sorex fumeus TaxID=62283 RepID=UPI0024ACB908|nr:galectin-2 [Sorex fumeus]
MFVRGAGSLPGIREHFRGAPTRRFRSAAEEGGALKGALTSAAGGTPAPGRGPKATESPLLESLPDGAGRAIVKLGKLELKSMDLKPGMALKLKGKIADDCPGFAINLGQTADHLNLHFNPRFGENTIIFNSKEGGHWGQEQRDSHMCFSPGDEVKITVIFESDEFKVKLPDGHELSFPNRLGGSHLTYLGVEGGLNISSIKSE